MIGFFVFDETPSLDKPLVLSHCDMNDKIKGYFYTRNMDTKDISSVSKGDTFFGVLDDASGYGACLFVKDKSFEGDSMLLEHNLHVKGNMLLERNLKVNGEITGKSTVTKLTFSTDDLLLLAPQLTLYPNPAPAVTTLNHVTVEMQNG